MMEGGMIRKLNRQIIDQNDECLQMITEMQKIEQFLGEFSFLSFNRDFIILGRRLLSLQMIMTSCELTLGSIISCCRAGSMADAYSLLRKYRDDLFFYLYVVVFDECNKAGYKSARIDIMKENIERWISNNLDGLYIGDVFQGIIESRIVKRAEDQYKLRSSFDSIRDRLNNYVHSNGILFYNRNVNEYKNDELQKQTEMLLKDMLYLTVTFLFFLALCSPGHIMSMDYQDCLDCNADPPQEAQFWVAPFIISFFKNNLDMIDDNCLEYLRKETPMVFE